jgi:hypothetical protein
MHDVLHGGYRLKRQGDGQGGVARWTVTRIGGVGRVGGVAPDCSRARTGAKTEVGQTDPPKPPNPPPGSNGYPAS